MQKAINISPNFEQNLISFVQNIVKHELENFKFKEQSVQETKWFTINEACDYIRVTKPTLWAMSKRGVIKKYYIDGQPRYKKSEIDASFMSVTRGGSVSND